MTLPLRLSPRLSPRLSLFLPLLLLAACAGGGPREGGDGRRVVVGLHLHQDVDVLLGAGVAAGTGQRGGPGPPAGSQKPNHFLRRRSA